MQVTIYGSSVSGSVTAPSSKSAMQRACALALVRKGNTRISSPGTSNDDKAALGIIQSLGAKVQRMSADEILVASQGVVPISTQVSCGESGLSIRMFTPIIATTTSKINIDGEGSLKSRPMDFFDKVLPDLGVRVKSNQGKLPLEVQGPIQWKNIQVSGEASSQYITGLLIAFASMGVNDGTSIEVLNLKSKPYIDLTLSMMEHFGYAVKNDNYRFFTFDKDTYSKVSTQDVLISIEGDWSGGAFLLVAGAIAGDIQVDGLLQHSTQADRAILDVLVQAKVDVHFDQQGHIFIKKSSVHPFVFDATDCPDLFPPLVALATHAQGISRIKGVQRLTHKESNRAITLQKEFAKLGVKIELDGDWMRIYGGEGILPFEGELFSHHDHRIAMALAVAVLPTSNAYHIQNADAINKSYPDFFEHLLQLGVRCEKNEGIV